KRLIISADYDDAPGKVAASIRASFNAVRGPIRAIVDATPGANFVNDGSGFDNAASPFQGRRALLVAVPDEAAEQVESALRKVPGVIAVERDIQYRPAGGRI